MSGALAFMTATRPGTYSIAATTASSNSATIPINAFLAITGGNPGPLNCLLSNEGPNTVFVEFGKSDVTAKLPSGSTAGSLAILSGATLTAVIIGGSYASGVTATGTGKLYLTPGTGKPA